MTEIEVDIETPDGLMNTFITYPDEGEMYFAFAENDEFIPPQDIDNLEAHLNTLDIDSRIEIYPGTVHGFTFPEGNEEYDEQTTERHWKEILPMFERRL